MSYHPPRQHREAKAPLRIAGALVSLLAAVLAAFALFLQPSVPVMLLAALVCVFAVRVFFLWLGASKAQPSGQSQLDYQGQPFASNGFNAHHGVNGIRAVPTPLAPPEMAFPVNGASQAAFMPGNAAVAPPLLAPQPAFAASAAYDFARSNTQTDERTQQLPGKQGELAQRAATIPYVPIEQDELFALDRSNADVCCFLLPKEGEPLVECQDRYALNEARRCYALADGVTGSFVPGPWARIVTLGFVERGGEFADKDDFQNWLADCSDIWHSWMETRWVPTMNALRARSGDRPGDWGNDMRAGAQTTLIGCTLRPDNDINNPSTLINVFAVGDCEFFLFSPQADGGWKLQDAFPFGDPAQFNARPTTLTTLPRADLLERAWLERKTMLLNASSGDRVVMASDTLAKWLLTQVQSGNSARWLPVISCTDSVEFEQRIRHEFQQDNVEDDDITMLVIPIS